MNIYVIDEDEEKILIFVYEHIANLESFYREMDEIFFNGWYLEREYAEYILNDLKGL